VAHCHLRHWSGQMQQGGGQSINGIAPTSGTNWIVYFNVSAGGGWTLTMSVSGTAGNQQVTPLVISSDCPLP
jgi:hypothetical protein